MTVDQILTVTDRATMMVVLIPCSSRWNAAEVAYNLYWEVVRYHGLPRSIISDRGPVFVSEFCRKSWTLKLGGTHHIIRRLMVKRSEPTRP